MGHTRGESRGCGGRRRVGHPDAICASTRISGDCDKSGRALSSCLRCGNAGLFPVRPSAYDPVDQLKSHWLRRHTSDRRTRGGGHPSVGTHRGPGRAAVRWSMGVHAHRLAIMGDPDYPGCPRYDGRLLRRSTLCRKCGQLSYRRGPGRSRRMGVDLWHRSCHRIGADRGVRGCSGTLCLPILTRNRHEIALASQKLVLFKVRYLTDTEVYGHVIKNPKESLCPRILKKPSNKPATPLTYCGKLKPHRPWCHDSPQNFRTGATNNSPGVAPLSSTISHTTW